MKLLPTMRCQHTRKGLADVGDSVLSVALRMFPPRSVQLKVDYAEGETTQNRAESKMRLAWNRGSSANLFNGNSSIRR